MGNVYHRLRKLPNYLERFGLLHGLKLLLQIERRLPLKSDITRRYRVPGYPAPVALRESGPDHSTFWQCLVACQYDIHSFPQSRRFIEAYKRLVARGNTPVIIDCGANIGLATIWFARQFPDAKIYAVEPDEGNLKVLMENTRTFGARVSVLNGGIWNQSGYLRIRNPGAGSAAFQVVPAEEPSEGRIRAYTVDEILEDAGGNGTSFIVKLDIEGAQRSLFSSNTDWVGATHLIALELDDWLMPWGGTSRPFFSCVSQYPLDYLIRGETLFCFRDFG